MLIKLDFVFFQEATHKEWGVSVSMGDAPAGAGISSRPSQLVTGRVSFFDERRMKMCYGRNFLCAKMMFQVWKGTTFGGWKSVESVPKLVDAYLRNDLSIDGFITKNYPLDEINDAFDGLDTSIRNIVHL